MTIRRSDEVSLDQGLGDTLADEDCAIIAVFGEIENPCLVTLFLGAAIEPFISPQVNVIEKQVGAP